MHPILFQLGGVTIYAYHVFRFLGFAVALFLVPRYARRVGLKPERAVDLCFILTVAGFVGSWLLQAILFAIQGKDVPWSVLIRSGGIWYGGVILALATIEVTARIWKTSFWTLLDAMSIPALLAGGVGRIGCFLSGCCFGSATGVPWAVVYDDPAGHRLHADLPYGPVHPVQLYELGCAVALALVLDRVAAKPRTRGTIGLLWIGLYGLIRTALEFFRGDAVRGALGPFSTSQWIGLATAAGSFALLWWFSRRDSEGKLVPQRQAL